MNAESQKNKAADDSLMKKRRLSIISLIIIVFLFCGKLKKEIYCNLFIQLNV
tara:strand:+ start:50 stop:205 length:156 start_codon:yes stop_codon:yes gene_type:complete